MKSNPFNYHRAYRYKLVYDKLARGDSVLDIGCGNGEFTSSLNSKFSKVYGVDFDKKAIKMANKKYPSITFKVQKKGLKIPFDNNTFDAVTLLEVIEHVGDEKAFLNEISRVLKPKGYLYLTTPHKGIFTFLDTGNIKFNFPRLHKSLYTKMYGSEEYSKMFEQSMYGDFSSKDMYHKHFTINELKVLLQSKFEIKQIIPYSMFAPIIYIGRFITERFTMKFNVFWNRLIYIDSSIFRNKYSYSVFVKAKNK